LRRLKIKGTHVFEVYDHTNDKMHIHCYQKKTGKQFVDFLKRLDRGYNKFVFLPIRSSELNLIEDGYGYKDRLLIIPLLKTSKK